MYKYTLHIYIYVYISLSPYLYISIYLYTYMPEQAQLVSQLKVAKQNSATPSGTRDSLMDLRVT